MATKRITKKRLLKQRQQHESFMMAMEKMHAIARMHVDLANIRCLPFSHGGAIVGVNKSSISQDTKAFAEFHKKQEELSHD